MSKALKAFEGGVVIITHSAEFTKDLTEEVWAVMDGKMTPSGHNWVSGQGSGPRLKGEDDDEEEKFDAMGNKIVSTKKKAKLTSSEARKKKKGKLAIDRLLQNRTAANIGLQSVWPAASVVRRCSAMRMICKPVVPRGQHPLP